MKQGRQIKRPIVRQPGKKVDRQEGRQADRQTRVKLEDRMWKETQRQTDGQNLPQPATYALLHWVPSHCHPPPARPVR